MKYLLDTNVCIRYLNDSSKLLIRKFETLPPLDIALCAIVEAELFYGAMKSKNSVQTLAKQHGFLQPYKSLPFDSTAASHCGRVRVYLENQRTPIDPYDLMIAAIALTHDLILVTHDQHFSRVPGLQIEDWEAL